MSDEVTKQQLKAGLSIVFAVAESIREVGECPSGPIYAALCGKVDMIGFEKIINTLVGAKLIEKRGVMLRWIGPTATATKETP